MYIQPSFDSSFQLHDLGESLYELTRAFRPRKILEVGALHGYSTHVFIQALRSLGWPDADLVTVDLFEDYQYKNCSLDRFKSNMTDIPFYPSNIHHEIIQCDILENLALFSRLASRVDLIFLDISNDADKLSILLRLSSCPVIFEGGSLERDNISWMQQYGKTPIRMLQTMGLHYGVIDKRFPSLSLFVP